MFRGVGCLSSESLIASMQLLVSSLSLSVGDCPVHRLRKNWSDPVGSDQFILRVRLHWSQNRHNTAKQHLSGYTLQERVATFKPTTVLSIATTLESYVHCSKYLARLSARNKLTLLAPDSRGRYQSSRIGFSVASDINSNVFDFYFLIWSLSRLLCCVGSGFSVAVDLTLILLMWRI
jgi:hypothetical protein